MSFQEGRISVVVPVYNRGSQIASTVEHLFNQTLPAHEIIVVDDGSTDDTPEKLNQLGSRIKVIRKENGGPASARNLGVLSATGEFVAFTDSDAFPDKDWLRNLVKGFDSGKVAGAGGVVRGITEGVLSEYADFKKLYDPGRDESGNVKYFATCNACFRRDVIVEAGLFNEKFPRPGGEDEELCQRVRSMGYELRLVDDALVLHRHKSLKDLLKAQANYGEGAYIMGTMWPERQWRGSARKGLAASLLSMFSLFDKVTVYRPQHGLFKGVAFAFLERAQFVAATWGYLRGQRKYGRKAA